VAPAADHGAGTHGSTEPRGRGDSAGKPRLWEDDRLVRARAGTKRARQWLATLRVARDAAPDRLARVYNVPVEPSIYRLLLDAGVDLIGTKRLAASAQVLRNMKAPSQSWYD
jgi:hypothetical protein